MALVACVQALAMAFGTSVSKDGSWPGFETGLRPGQVARIERAGGQIVAANCALFPARVATGFDIHMQWTQHNVTADFGGLVQDFGSVDEALSWAEGTFTEDYRLRTDFIGRRPWRWTLEKITSEGSIVTICSSGQAVWFSAWGRPSTEYRSNFISLRA